jgi:hypothetical protein
MSIAFQASLFDDLQAEPTLGALGGEVERLDLGQGAWLDIRPGWVADSDALFERLVEDVEWTADTRLMHGRVVEVPRLLSWFGPRATLPAPVLVEAREALNDHYGRPPGQVLETAGLCFYRTGDDSVAWHGAGAPSTATPWSPSSPSAPPAPCRSGRRAAASCGASRSGTATSWSWAAAPSARTSTPSSRRRRP